MKISVLPRRPKGLLPWLFGRNGSEKSLEGSDGGFDWSQLALLLIHPVKVTIVEALAETGTAVTIRQVRGRLPACMGEDEVTQHLLELIKAGVVEESRIPDESAPSSYRLAIKGHDGARATNQTKSS